MGRSVLRPYKGWEFAAAQERLLALLGAVGHDGPPPFLGQGKQKAALTTASRSRNRPEGRPLREATTKGYYKGVRLG
jgi:hypothetical protein